MAEEQGSSVGFVRRVLGVFRYSRRALDLVWTTSRTLTFTLALLTLVAGVLPAVIAFIGQLIVDGVVAGVTSTFPDTRRVLWLVLLEAIVVISVAASQRGISASQSLLRALLGQRVNVMILEKALTLQLANFEDSEFYDKLTQARREASSRPLSLVNRTFGLVQNGISLTSYAVLLFVFSPRFRPARRGHRQQGGRLGVARQRSHGQLRSAQVQGPAQRSEGDGQSLPRRLVVPPVPGPRLQRDRGEQCRVELLHLGQPAQYVRARQRRANIDGQS